MQHMHGVVDLVNSIPKDVKLRLNPAHSNVENLNLRLDAIYSNIEAVEVSTQHGRISNQQR